MTESDFKLLGAKRAEQEAAMLRTKLSVILQDLENEKRRTTELLEINAKQELDLKNMLIENARAESEMQEWRNHCSFTSIELRKEQDALASLDASRIKTTEAWRQKIHQLELAMAEAKRNSATHEQDISELKAKMALEKDKLDWRESQLQVR